MTSSSSTDTAVAPFAGAPVQSLSPATPTPSGPTPTKRKRDKHSPKTSALNRYLEMAKQLHGDFNGAMAPRRFLEDFMTPAGGLPNVPQVPGDFFKGIPEDKLESDMYKAFIELFVNEFTLPGLKWSARSSQSDPASEKDNKIIFDVGLYSSTVDLTNFKTLYEFVQLLLEFKRKIGRDGFVDPTPGSTAQSEWESTAGTRASGRGQIAHYVLEQLRHQHRKFVFAGYIAGPTVRFYRWDYAGIIVSESINYKENPQVLFDFFWRFAHMSQSERGWDETVRTTNPHEDAIARKMLDQWKGDRAEHPTRVIWVPVIEAKTTKEDLTKFAYRAEPCKGSSTIDSEGLPADGRYYRKFLAWVPFARPDSPTGRGTYCYPVYEEKSNKCCFLKEQWRGNRMEKEGDILSDLNAKHVKNVPVYVCGDDIPGPGHKTATDTYTDLPNGSAEPRIHYRFVEDVIAAPLDTFTSSRQLMQAVFDAYIAHKEAFTKCHILHRDISPGNIMLIGGDHGILNDWDLCIRVDRDNNSPRQKERTGTWPFMSVGLLKNRHKLHDAQDDMESFLYVLLYLGLPFLENDLSKQGPEEVDSFMRRFFDLDEQLKGGLAKAGFFFTGPPITFTKCPPLTDFFKSVTPLITDYIWWFSKARDSGADPSSSTIPEWIALRNHDALEGLWVTALAADWPKVADREKDQRSKPPTPGALGSMRTESTHATSASASVHSHRSKRSHRSQRGGKRGRDESDAPTEGSQGKKSKTTTPKASASNTRVRSASQSTTSTLISR